jgi:hypothetical protein
MLSQFINPKNPISKRFIGKLLIAAQFKKDRIDLRLKQK